MKYPVQKLIILLLMILTPVLYNNCSGGSTIGNPLSSTPPPTTDEVELRFASFNPSTIPGNSLDQLKICITYIIFEWERLDEEIDFTGRPSYFEWQPNVFVEQISKTVFVTILEEIDFNKNGVIVGNYQIPEGEYSNFQIVANTLNNINGGAQCTDPSKTVNLTNSHNSFESSTDTYIEFDQTFTFSNQTYIDFSIQEYVDLVIQQTTPEDFEANAVGQINF